MNTPTSISTDVDTLATAPQIRKLLETADAAVRGALNANFSVDELFGPELSGVISRGGSLQKRHGNLLQHGIAAALEASGRFVVQQTETVVITTAADSLVASTPPEAMGRINLRYDSPAVRTVNLDLIVIDEDAEWAGAYDCKRGGGALTQRLQRPLVRDLEAARLLLRAHLRDRGYSRVDRVSVGVLDIYGASGLPDHLVVRREHLDDMFGVPVEKVLRLLTDRVRAGFEAGIAPFLADLQKRSVEPPARAPRRFARVADLAPEPGFRTPAREEGPRAIRNAV